jgi:hypothetical protein
MTPVSDTFTVLKSFTGVKDTGMHALPVSLTPAKTCIRRCQWHWQSMYLPVSLTPAMHVTCVVDTGDVMHHWCHWYWAVNIANFAGVNDTGYACLCQCQWHRWCTSRTFGSSWMPLKEQSLKIQAISKYYFSIASIKSSKESSNYNKIVCFAGVSDTGEAGEKSNISANIWKKSKSSLGLPTGARRSCLKKKNRGEKSGGTVPLTSMI